MYSVYAGGIASFRPLKVIQFIPYACTAFCTLFGFIPNDARSDRLALLAVVTKSGSKEWSQAHGATTGNEHSKKRCRWVRNPNIEPQSMTGLQSSFFAPATFSIMYGSPEATSFSLTLAIRSGWLFLLCSGVRLL
jgi:hypothetical protein